MRKIICYNDVHEGGPHPVKVQWDFGKDCFYLGDNIDLSHALKADIPKLLLDLKHFARIFEGRFVRGNHELNAVDGPDWLKVGNTLLTHGDFIFWPKKYAMHYRMKRPKGTHWLRRWLSLSGLDFLRHFLPEARLSRRLLRKMALMASKHKCSMVVTAHRHPKNVIRAEYNGIKVIVLPPGRNEVEIE